MSTTTANRAVRPGWRDPRLLAGVALMAVSVLVGAWVLSGADDSVAVLSVRHALAEGAKVSVEDLGTTRVRFADPDAAERYLAADSALPADAVLRRPLAAGELVPRAAVGSARTATLIEVPLRVATEDVPSTVRSGSVVDVWAVAEDGAPEQEARRVLERVTVLRLGGRAESLAPSPTRQVIVGIPAADQERLASALGRAAAGRLILTRRP